MLGSFRRPGGLARHVNAGGSSARSDGPAGAGAPTEPELLWEPLEPKMLDKALPFIWPCKTRASQRIKART